MRSGIVEVSRLAPRFHIELRADAPN